MSTTDESGSQTPQPQSESVRNVAVDLLKRGHYQPRRHFSEKELDELAETIVQVGVIQPIIVRSVQGGRYEIIAGERRWRASQKAGLDYVPAIVRDVPDDVVAAMSIIENIQREDLNPIEEALSFERLLEDFDYQHDQLAEQLGKSRSAISNSLRLLKLPLRVKEWIEKGDLSPAVGKSLAAIEDVGVINRLAARCLKTAKSPMSIRALENAIKEYKETGILKGEQPTPKKRKPRDIQRLEQYISEKIGFPAEVNINPKTQVTELVFRAETAAGFGNLLDSLKPISLDKEVY